MLNLQFSRRRLSKVFSPPVFSKKGEHPRRSADGNLYRGTASFKAGDRAPAQMFAPLSLPQSERTPARDSAKTAPAG